MKRTKQRVSVKQRGPVTVRKTVTVTKTIKPRKRKKQWKFPITVCIIITEMIKKLTLLTGMIALVIGISGCTATATVGKTANPPWFNADASKDGVSVTLPFVKAGVAPEKEQLPCLERGTIIYIVLLHNLSRR